MLVLDPGSPVPPYEQVRRQIADQALTGVLAPGHRLPTVRRLAEDLGIAVNTVARAYRELEQDGVVVTRGRHGTFVAVRGENRDREAAAAARVFVRRLRELGVPDEHAVDVLRATLATPDAS